MGREARAIKPRTIKQSGQTITLSAQGAREEAKIQDTSDFVMKVIDDGSEES